MTKAIIMAGGLGARLRPLTDKIPKPLLNVKGKPMMQYSIENLRDFGIKDITIGISYNPDKIKDYFLDGKKLGVKISYSYEKEPLGTGGGVKQAASNIKNPFILIWGDNLSDIDFSEMFKMHKNSKALITIALTQREDVENWGVAKLIGNKVVGFIEKPKREEAPSNLINAGVFIIDPKVLDFLPPGKSSIEKDCFEKLAGENGSIFSYVHTGQWFPTDNIEKYLLANKLWRPK